jgi:hypothetical protein
VGRESGCRRTKGCILLSSDKVRDITVLSALRRCCCLCVCVCVRACVRVCVRAPTFSGGEQGTDGRTGGV